jgi:DNA-binding PadR family transcriptional regulator
LRGDAFRYIVDASQNMRTDDLVKETPTMNTPYNTDDQHGHGQRGHGPWHNDENPTERDSAGHGRRGHGPRARLGGFGPRGGRGPGHGPGFGGPGFGGPAGLGFGPGGPRGRGGRARKGDVRSAILSLLAEAPASGYGLMKSIAEKTQDAWRPSPGSVYPTLAQLVDEQLIEPTDPTAARSDFRLTETGQAYVAEHGEQIAAAWDIDAGDEDGKLRGAAMKLMGALRQFGADATPDQRQRAAEKVDQLRRELYAILGE